MHSKAPATFAPLGQERLAGLVAYHSGARCEAELRRLAAELAEFADEARENAVGGRRVWVVEVVDALHAAVLNGDVAAHKPSKWPAKVSNTPPAPSRRRCSNGAQLLSKVMAAAVDADMIPQTPCRRVPLPRIERKEMRFLSPAEVWKLAVAIASEYRALILLGAFGGLRIGEMAGLRRGAG